MKKETMMKTGMVLGMFVLLISFASSFAVSSMYWEGKPILAIPGESVDFFVVLQNIAGEGGDVSVQGLFAEGGDVAEFTDESNVYFVPFGEKVNVNMSATVPEGAVVGDVIELIVSFKVIAEESGGQFGFGVGVEREIPIQVVGVTEEVEDLTSYNYVYYLVGLIVLILVIIIYALFKRKNVSTNV